VREVRLDRVKSNLQEIMLEQMELIENSQRNRMLMLTVDYERQDSI